jgi:hypothetical protein
LQGQFELESQCMIGFELDAHVAMHDFVLQNTSAPWQV